MKRIRALTVACLCLVIAGTGSYGVARLCAGASTFQLLEFDEFGDPLREPDLPYHANDDPDELQLEPEAWAAYLYARRGCATYASMPGMWDVPVLKKDTGVRPRYFAHGGPVVAVAFAPDGKTVATGTGSHTFSGLYEGLVRLWDPNTGQQLRLLGVSGPAVTSLAFSPDGKLLTAASWAPTVQVWDVATGQECFCLEHPAGVTGVAFAPDGKTLAAATMVSPTGYTVHIWDLATGKELRRLQGRVQDRSGRCYKPVIVRYTPDGKAVAATPRQHEPISLWDVATGKQDTRLSGCGDVETFEFSPDGTTLALDSGGDIFLVDFSSGRMRLTITGDDRSSNGIHLARLAFAPDGRTMAAVNRDKSASVWEVSTGKERCRASLHTDDVAAVAFSPDGRSLLTGSLDETARIWDVTGWDRRHGSLPKEVSAAQLEALWKTLRSEDGLQAHEAIWALVQWREQAVPLLHACLKPDPAVERRIALLIADLNSEQFAVRQKATQALEALGEPTEVPLRKVLQQRHSLEFSRRVEQVLDRLEATVLPSHRARRERASEVLEQIGTPEARRVLKSLGLDTGRAQSTSEK